MNARTELPASQAAPIRRNRRALPVIALALAVALIATACGGSATTDSADDDTAAPADSSDQDRPTVAAEEPTAAPPSPEAETPTAAEPTAEPEPDPTATPEPTPAPATSFWGSDLQAGDCIDRLAGNPPFEPPDVVPCDGLHQEEIYAYTTLDRGADEPYPGTDELAEIVDAELCADATVDFVGETWEDIGIPTLLLYPTEEEWLAGDRNIGCSISSPDDGASMIGTAAGGSIDSSDVLVARAHLANAGEEFDDWVVVTELATVDTVGSLTDGQFALPLRRPFAAPQGFLFNAEDTGAVGSEISTFGYNWSNGEITDLGSILPGAELASTIVAPSGDIVFAARDGEGDDWDLLLARDGDIVDLAAGEGNQQYPTLTPDGSRVVYHDGGDIWVVGVDGSNPVQLTSGPATDWESIVSPDGTTVVFASDRSGNDDLWSVGIDGGEPVQLTDHPANESWPVFSADGELIYFATDRLRPEARTSRLMVMEADGSNSSWFAAMDSSQAVVVDETVADALVTNTPTLDERYNYELIAGEPGTGEVWAHSSGRLGVQLPVGWRVGEINEQIGFLASPRPGRYFDTWGVDGVLVLLYDGETQDEFFAHYDEADAVTTCEQFDGSDGVVPIEGTIVGRSGNFNCGADSVGGVLAFYDTATGVGVTIEGQRDNLPDADSDADMLTAIARSLRWE